MSLIFLSILLCSQLSLLLAANQKVVCYWPNWHMHDKAPYHNAPEDIDASLCTHIHYAFSILDETHETPKDSEGSPQVEVYKRLSALKQKNTNLKLILSLGGWGDDGGKYSRMSASSEKRKTFITNAIQYLHKYSFDGLDIDWEFPVCWLAECGKGHEADKENFGKLLQELRAEFDKQEPKLSLSAAVNSGEDISNEAYDFKALGAYLDYVNVMTYDNHGVWDNKTGHHSTFEDSKAALEYYHAKGIPKEKLLIGVPFYGRTFTLKDPKIHGIDAPITGEGAKMPSGDDGNANYWEICVNVKTHGWVKVLADAKQGHDPYAYHQNQWVGYDDPNQAYQKAKFSKDNGYGGVLIWEITQDDIHKKCCNVAYPMLKAINFGLFGTGQNPSTYGCE